MPGLQITLERPRPCRPLAVRQFADPLAFLTVENAFLEETLARLDRLAGAGEGNGAERTRRRAHARRLLDYFHVDLALYVDDENAVLEMVEQCDLPTSVTDDIAEEIHGEHAMLWRLLGPVRDGLEEIVAMGSALMTERFTIAVMVLTTFMRMHCGQTRGALVPLAAAALDPAQLETLGREMAYRRGLGSC